MPHYTPGCPPPQKEIQMKSSSFFAAAAILAMFFLLGAAAQASAEAPPAGAVPLTETGTYELDPDPAGGAVTPVNCTQAGANGKIVVGGGTYEHPNSGHPTTGYGKELSPGVVLVYYFIPSDPTTVPPSGTYEIWLFVGGQPVHRVGHGTYTKV